MWLNLYQIDNIVRAISTWLLQSTNSLWLTKSHVIILEPSACWPYNTWIHVQYHYTSMLLSVFTLSYCKHLIFFNTDLFYTIITVSWLPHCHVIYSRWQGYQISAWRFPRWYQEQLRLLFNLWRIHYVLTAFYWTQSNFNLSSTFYSLKSLVPPSTTRTKAVSCKRHGTPLLLLLYSFRTQKSCDI